MEVDSPFDFPDMVAEIMSYLPTEDLLSLGMLSRTTYSILDQRLRIKYPTRDSKYGVRLHHRQLLALLLVDNGMKVPCVLSAPPSFGKTVVGIYRALELIKSIDQYVLIIAPSKTISTWVKEIKTFFGGFYDRKNPQDSTILVFESSTHKLHAKYIRDRMGGPGLEKRVILCSMMTKSLNHLSFSAEFLVVDEPQVGNWANRISGMALEGSILALTADREYQIRKSTEKRFLFPFGTITDEAGSLPVIDYSYEFVHPEGWLDAAKPRILNMEKAVLFIASDSMMIPKSPLSASFKIWCLDNGRKLYRFVKSTKSIELFDRAPGKAVLVANIRTATEGVNMVGDGVVVINPLCISGSRLFQCVSRLVRTSNSHKKISCHLLEMERGPPPPLRDFMLRLTLRCLAEKKYLELVRSIDPYLFAHRRSILAEMGLDPNALTLTDIYVLGGQRNEELLPAALSLIRKMSKDSILLQEGILRKCMTRSLHL